MSTNSVQVINSIRDNSEEEFHKLFLDVENVLSLVDETAKTLKIDPGYVLATVYYIIHFYAYPGIRPS